MDASGRDLVEFWNWAAERGEMNRNTAAALRSACKEVLSTVEAEGWETLDLRELDVESFSQRFVRLKSGSTYKPESLSRYKARFKRALEMYLRYLDAPDKWQYQPATPEASTKNGGAAGRGPKPSKRESGRKMVSAPADEAQMVEYPYPLRPWRGVRASLTLPEDLTRQEAQRLAAFVTSLAVDPQLALPPGPMHEQEAS